MFGRGHEVVSGGRANNNIYCHQSRAAIGTLCDIIKGLLSNPVVVFGDFIDRLVQGFLHNIFHICFLHLASLRIDLSEFSTI